MFALYSGSVSTGRDFILQWTELYCGEKLLPVLGEEKLGEAQCCLVRAGAVAGPVGGYYNSCSFALWPGISSPQGQRAVSGILIGKSQLIFTSLQILPHLLANEERFCDPIVLEGLIRIKTTHTINTPLLP